MKSLKLTIITLAVLGAVISVGYVALIIYININSEISLAKDIAVTSDWTEITIKPAISAEYRHQSINLITPNIDSNSKFDGIHLQDGTVLRPELELIDEKGSIQPLALSGFTRKYDLAANYGAAEGTLGFSKSRKFVTLRIKSDFPFACKSISWVDYDPK